MKPELREPMSAERYYYIKWRTHSLRFILALALLANAIIFALLAAFYGRADVALWLCVVAVFFLFVSVIKAKDATRYHDLHLRALCDGSILNSHHTNQ